LGDAAISAYSFTVDVSGIRESAASMGGGCGVRSPGLKRGTDGGQNAMQLTFQDDRTGLRTVQQKQLADKAANIDAGDIQAPLSRRLRAASPGHHTGPSPTC
jgi:hypothetical protein